MNLYKITYRYEDTENPRSVFVVANTLDAAFIKVAEDWEDVSATELKAWVTKVKVFDEDVYV